jgi:hypothetical protein
MTLAKDLEEARQDPAGYLANMGYLWEIEKLPEPLREGFARWYLMGIPAGQFLQAVIRNDLSGAVIKADAGSLANIRNIVIWFYNNAPPICVGDNVKAWGEAGGYFGRARAAEVAARDRG